ncbi:hypothetical protein M8C13_24650 [Crossiella sp. SN42]|uniref:hypothetical protein n=1 Tax=Crossiella sp. SN42 TaxID=2944808 RepID=UPI00207D49E5|nr:hypothetical protein [Crossiella sp. SN42]MCO1578948.1 hypothetical protein [Crossiella sp. SN42]
MARCERCDLPVGQCPHTRRRVVVRTEPDLILVSRTNTAHLPGACNHDAPPDYRGWGEIRGVPRAWERLGNAEAIPATGGDNPARVADKRCRHCAASF